MSLSKRDRALCLFNADVLRTKVAEAIDVLAVVSGDDDEPAPPSSVQKAAPATPTPKAKDSSDYPQTPDLSFSSAPSVSSPQTPQNTSTTTTTYTLAALARLPAIEIIKLANSTSSSGAASTGLPLAKADPLIVQQTNQFIDSLEGKTNQQQKQLLGEKLYVYLPFLPLFTDHSHVLRLILDSALSNPSA